jgi:hypothetical protein
MKLSLKKIASIQMGCTFRQHLDFMDNGTTAAVQMTRNPNMDQTGYRNGPVYGSKSDSKPFKW